MTTRLSKQQLLDGLKQAGVDIPANASSARLRELYEHIIIGNTCKNVEAPAVLTEVTAATAILSLEDTAANTDVAIQPIEAKGSTPKRQMKTKATEEKINFEVMHDTDVKSDAASNTSDDTASHQDHSNEAADLDHQLQILRKRHEILKLQRDIAVLENGESTQHEVSPAMASFAASSRFTFRDLEHTIIKFDGENRAYSVHDFLRSFERVMDMVGADELFKYTSLCNSLAGTARLILNKTDVVSFTQLREELIKEFGRAINRSEIYKMLANYKWNRKDNIRRYVLEMEGIASRCDQIDEFELIGFIIEGMQDNTPEACLLMNARTMSQFKESLDLYERRRANRLSINRDAAPSKLKGIPVKSPEINTSNSDMNEVRCYNCTQKGHYQSKCPYDKRPNGSCFRCWQMGHDHRSCTNPKKSLIPRKKEVAAICSDESDANYGCCENAVDAVNNSD